jgi:hypothetical protein
LPSAAPRPRPPPVLSPAPLPLTPHTRPRQPPDPYCDPRAREAATLVARKRLQLEHLREYDEAVVGLKAKVKEAEGQDMREAIQDKVPGGGGARGRVGAAGGAGASFCRGAPSPACNQGKLPP